jgi:L-lysine exporter family protein LysE/ArgO
MIHAFIYGVVLAFGLIIPLGVQNVFVFNQGATQRHFLHAMPSVLTASLCDMALIILSVLGISVAVFTIPWLKTVIYAVGFFFLIYMGWLTWKNKPAKLKEGQKPLSAKRQIGFAISVSLLNPHALLDTIGVIGTSSLNFIGDAKLAYTAACIIVSFCWFFGLSVAGHFLHRLDKTGVLLKVVNKLSALIIWSVALYFGWQLIEYLVELLTLNQ